MLLIIFVAIATLLGSVFFYTYRWNLRHPNHSGTIYINGYERFFIYHVPKNVQPNPKLIRVCL